MSWYKRRPRVKEPLPLAPRERSPMSEKILKEQKQAVSPEKKKK